MAEAAPDHDEDGDDAAIAAIEARLAAGEWLGLEELAALFGKDKTTISRWIHKKRLMGFRREPGGGPTSKIYANPVHVRALLAKWRTEEGGENALV